MQWEGYMRGPLKGGKEERVGPTGTSDYLLAKTGSFFPHPQNNVIMNPCGRLGMLICLGCVVSTDLTARFLLLLLPVINDQ